MPTAVHGVLEVMVDMPGHAGAPASFPTLPPQAVSDRSNTHEREKESIAEP